MAVRNLPKVMAPVRFRYPAQFCFMEESIISEIIAGIKKSKKYGSVYDKTIERIVRNFSGKNNNLKEVEKKSRNLLHQIWGAFYPARPDFKKLILKMESDVKSGKNSKEIILPILALQSSVKERIPSLDNLYKKIFEITGIPKIITDHACGLNPLTLPWMNLPETTEYRAFDIDTEQAEFLKSAVNILGLKNKIEIGLGDILADDFDYSDIVFLFKLLPCIEHQKKNSGLEILKKIKCKYAVVSFPAGSLSGKKRGMADFYRDNFKKLVEKENWEIKEILFDTELVFVIKK